MTMIRRLRLAPTLLALLSAAALILTGCPDGNTGVDGGPGDGDGDGDDLVAQLATAYVAYFDDCGGVSNELYNLLEPGTQMFDTDGLGDYLKSALTAEGVVQDDAAAADCVALVEQLAATCGSFADDVLNDTCSQAWSGTLEGGESCTYVTQCASGDCPTSGDNCGTCAGRAGDGEDCSELSCEDDLWCNNDDVCETYRQENEACEDDDGFHLCDFDLTCDYDLDEPICVSDDVNDPPVMLDEGDACPLDDYDACDAYSTSLVCADDGNDDLIGTCQPVVAVDEGEVCDLADTNQPVGVRACLNMFSSHFCVTQPDGTGLCEARPGTGDECGAVPCDENSTCDYETMPPTCEALPGEGEPCPDYDCAGDLYCDDDDNDDETPGVCTASAGLIEVAMCEET